MELKEMMSIDDWIAFEETLFDKFRLNCTIYDTTGHRITGRQYWCNNLCPKVQANKEAQTTICAGGNQYFMAEAEKSRKTVIGECDAGLIKIVVPIFLNDQFIGAAGGCGLLNEEGEIEEFLIQKLLGLSEDEVAELCRDIKHMSDDQAALLVEFIEKRIDQLVSDFSKSCV